MDLIHIGDLSLGTLSFGDSVHVDAGALGDFFLIVLCLKGHALVRGHEDQIQIGRNRGYICSPGMPFEATFSENCEQLFIKVDRKAFDKHVGVAPSAFRPVLELSCANLTPWRMQMEMVSSCVEFTRMVTQSPLVRTEFERLFIALLMEGQSHKHEAPTPRSTAPGTIRRAEAFIRANYGKDLCLNDVAAAAGISARTLLFSFKNFRDITPMQYLRAIRLQHARAKLKDASSCSNVTDIALECGFMHLGRFSSAYRDFFGEMPSETLRRSRRGKSSTH